MARRDEDAALEIRPPTGGLQTKFAPQVTLPSQTPDALNVLFDGRSAKRRAGSVPVNRYRAGRLSLRNVGETILGKLPDNTQNVTYKTVSGYGVIGHRDWMDSYRLETGGDAFSSFTLSFLVRPEPHGSEIPGPGAVNWWDYNPNAAGNATHTYSFRPIISKGMLGSTAVNPANPRNMAFRVGIQRGDGGVPVWRAFINYDGGAADLQTTASSPRNPRPHRTYRITVTLTGNDTGSGVRQARMVVAELMDDGLVSSDSVLHEPASGAMSVVRGPLVLFDAPPAAFGEPNYKEAVLRFEGSVEDVSMWATDKVLGGTPADPPVTADPDLTFALSFEPLDPGGDHPGLLGLWTPTLQSERIEEATQDEDRVVLLESTGRDAPVLLCPREPAWNRATGRTSLYFDGRTAYAFMPMSYPGPDGAVQDDATANPNTGTANSSAPSSDGLWKRMLDAGGGALRHHSVRVEVIPDSLETRADTGASHAASQCIVQWWPTCEIGLSTQGRVYARAASGSGMSSASFGSTLLEPGRRYEILFRRESAAVAKVFVNGVEEVELSGLTTPGSFAMRPLMLGTRDKATTDFEAWRVGESDPDLHFLGRVESLDIATGLLPTEPADDAIYEPFDVIYRMRGGNTTLVGHPRSAVPMIASPERRFVEGPQTFSVSARDFVRDGIPRLALAIGTADMTTVNLSDPAPPSPPDGPADAHVTVRFTPYLARWRFGPNTLALHKQSRYRGGAGAATWQAEIFERNAPGSLRGYEERAAVPDDLGFVYPLTLRSREPDFDSMLGFSFGETGQRLYDTTPVEKSPRVAAGLVPSPLGRNPVTLLANFKPRPADRFPIMGAAGAIYWLAPPWRKGDSPYSRGVDPGQVSLFASGRHGNHAEIRSNSDWSFAGQSPFSDDRTIEVWIKPLSMEADQDVACLWAGAPEEEVWRIYITRGGAVVVEGQDATAGFWQIRTKAGASGPGASVIRPGVWQHLVVTLDRDAIANDQILLDGFALPVAVTAGTGHANPVNPGRGYIAGLPLSLGDPRATLGAVKARPLHGLLRDFRISQGVRYQDSYSVPGAPLQADADTVTLLPMTEGEDLLVSGVGEVPVGAKLRMRELLPILPEMTFSGFSSMAFPWDHATYLGTLYTTNGHSRPVAIRHRGDGPPEQPAPEGAWGSLRRHGFTAVPMGVEQPPRDRLRLIGITDNAEGPFLHDQVYQVAVTFVTEDGHESNPIFETLRPEGSNSSGRWNGLRILNLPRPREQPHVVARRIYLGTVRALQSLHHSRTADPLTDQVELHEVPLGPDLSLTRAAPPAARFIEIHRERSYMLHVAKSRDLPLRPSSLVFSMPGEPERYSFSPRITEGEFFNELFLETAGGTPGSFLQEHFGRLWAGKRDSIFHIASGANPLEIHVERANTSKGYAAAFSVVSFDNHMFGAMEKGVHVFAGGGLEYVSEDLEGLWRDLDLSEAGLMHFRGAFLESRSQYWLAAKRHGEQFGRDFLVLDMTALDPMTQRRPWSLVRTMPHTALAVVEDPVDDLPSLWIGTPHGQVYELLRGGAEGVRDEVVSEPWQAGDLTLTPTVIGGSSSLVLVTPPRFRDMGDGFVGVPVRIRRGDGLDALAAEGVIARHQEGSIAFNLAEPLVDQHGQAFTPTAGDIMEIGAYRAYWSTPWLALSGFSTQKLARFLDFDFAPEEGSLGVWILGTEGGQALVREFPFEAVPEDLRKEISMTLGYHEDTLRMASRGLYLRVAVGTHGIRRPFEVFGLSLAYSQEALRKGVM